MFTVRGKKSFLTARICLSVKNFTPLSFHEAALTLSYLRRMGYFVFLNPGSWRLAARPMGKAQVENLAFMPPVVES